MNTKETEEDPRYSKGQIYKIISPNIEKIYIGSTIKELDVRFSNHKSKKNCTSMHIINEGNASIELMYEYPCKNKIELELEEGRRMQAFRKEGFEVVNKHTAGAYAAAGGIKEYHKEYNKINKEKGQEYRKANKEKLAEYNKEYLKSNKEKIAETQAERRKNMSKVACECCNKDFKKADFKQHVKTKKYINNMKQINDISN